MYKLKTIIISIVIFVMITLIALALILAIPYFKTNKNLLKISQLVDSSINDNSVINISKYNAVSNNYSGSADACNYFIGRLVVSDESYDDLNNKYKVNISSVYKPDSGINEKILTLLEVNNQFFQRSSLKEHTSLVKLNTFDQQEIRKRLELWDKQIAKESLDGLSTKKNIFIIYFMGLEFSNRADFRCIS